MLFSIITFAFLFDTIAQLHHPLPLFLNVYVKSNGQICFSWFVIKSSGGTLGALHHDADVQANPCQGCSCTS